MWFALKSELLEVGGETLFSLRCNGASRWLPVSRNALKTVCIDLPDYIVSMLNELSRYLGISPSQLLVKVLHPIYEVWRAAREADARISTATTSTSIASAASTRINDVDRAISIDAVVEDFANRYSGERWKKFAKTVAEEFLAWLSNRGIDVCTAAAEHIDQYVNEVIASRFFSQKTVKNVVGSLRSFLAYAKPRLCRSSARTRSLLA